jgi:hypothetical protein
MSAQAAAANEDAARLGLNAKHFQNFIVEEFSRREREVRYAAKWCAVKGLRGVVGDPLPDGLSTAAVEAINANPSAFTLTVTKYRLERMNIRKETS